MAYTTTIQDKNGNQRTIKDPEALRANAQANNTGFDAAYIGMGYGTCSTAAATAAKTATLSNYLLLKNVPVSILFTSGISVAGATLNINSQGAKALYYMGAPVQPGTVRPNTIVTLVYDGTRYNITSIEGMQQGGSPSDLYVDMGLPSGLLWAKADIDVTTDSGFTEVDGAVSPYKYEKSFFSWGNTEGHNPSSTSAFSYNWGGVNDSEPYYDGQVYGSTPGNDLTGNIAAAGNHDAARANLGAPWRMPTTAEFAELFANIDYLDASGNVISSETTDKRVTVNSILGLRLRSKINSNELFFAASGYGLGTSWGNRGSDGLYWSSSFSSARGARYLSFYSGGVYPQYSYGGRYVGRALRPVQ